MDVLDVAECGSLSCDIATSETQTHGAEVKTMGIDTEIVGCILIASVLLVFHGIHFLVAMAKVKLLFGLGGGQVACVLERVPSPVGHGRERNAVGVSLWKTLQPRGIYGGSEVTVAHGECTECVHLIYNGVVTSHHSLAVDAGCGVVGVVSECFHLKRGPDERAYALGIVVPYLFAQVVLV